MLQRIDGILHNHTPTAYEEFTEISVAVLLLPPDPVPAHNGASTSSCWHEAFHYSQGNDSTLPEIVLCLISRVQNDTERTCPSQIILKYTECGRNAGWIRAMRNEKESPKLWLVCSGEWRNGNNEGRGEIACLLEFRSVRAMGGLKWQEYSTQPSSMTQII